MRKFTVILFALIVSAFAMQSLAGPSKAPARSAIFNSLPAGFQQLGNTTIYYNVSERTAAGPGAQTGFSILGKIGDYYYSSTYERNDVGMFSTTYREGAGFIAAFKVNNNNAVYLNAATGTTANGVNVTARIEPHGDVAALITYTLKNNTNAAVTVNAGVWGDIMIGDNDYAPLERLVHDGDAYGLKLKYSTAQNAPLMCALFGEGITGVTPADDFWFGQYRNNYQASEIVGVYDNIYEHQYQAWYGTYYEDEVDENYMVENGNYDSGMGFCWKNRMIPAGESIELSYIISVGEIEYEEPFVPGDDRFEYEVEAFDFEGWNDLSVAHPAHVFGYYEHPYAQNGYIEYQVDDENTWHRIPAELVSGENFDLNFDMFFNQNRTTDHVLNLRFNDGLDNVVPMDGLSWTDVRSIPVNGLDDRAYNGEPQIYEVTIGDGEPFTIGENGEYVEPGDYTFSFEGAFADNTIGVNETVFTIGKGQSEITYVIPDDCVYDGAPHGATVTLVVGDGDLIVTYVNTETGEVLTDAPVNAGNYDVVVMVTETNYYYGIEETVIGNFTIDKAQSQITYTIPDDVTYDGEPHAATVTLVVGDGDLTVTYRNVATGDILTSAPVEEGTYEVIVVVTETENYYGIEETVIGSFTILSKHTAVEELNINAEDNGAWYTIDGRRVAAPAKGGIYIHNGKKYIVK